MISNPVEKKQAWVWGGVVAGIAILQRVALFTLYPPVAYNDTPSYRRLAEAILNGGGYDGTRTPGYPAFLALLGADRSVYLVQLILGLLITTVFFYLGWRITHRPILGAAAALAHSFNLGQLFFEANLITETLSTFWVALALLGAFFWFERPAQPRYSTRSILLAFGIGLTSALAALTRPLFIYLPVLLVFFIGLCEFVRVPGLSLLRRLRSCWPPVLAILVPAGLLIGGWVYYINSTYGMLSLSTMNGYHLMQHTGIFFEYAPDQYADLRDVYLQYRAERIRQYGTQGNTIWDAIPAMQKVSGLSFYDLSRTLSTISIQLILQHPDLYLRNCLEGWWMFWRAPFYWSDQQVLLPWLKTALKSLVLLERALLVGMNLLFVGISIVALAWRKLRKGIGFDTRPFFWGLLAANIWSASVVQTLLDHGDNPRFLVPLQSWVVWIVLFGAFSLWQNWKGKGSKWTVS